MRRTSYGFNPKYQEFTMEDDSISEIREKILKELIKKQESHKKNVLDSQEYQDEKKYLLSFTSDMIDTLRTVSLYSKRGGGIYENFLTIRSIDDILQSIIGIKFLAENGIHNIVKRELRYMIEMTTKYVIVDYDKMGDNLDKKIQYLNNQIPDSSIDIIDTYSTPFDKNSSKLFRDEVKDFFYKSCAFVHPSKKQLEGQLNNYKKGNTIGFETAKMFRKLNKLIFRAYDMILTMIFHGFGSSMSKDLFEQVFNENREWKFHKGKYVKKYSVSF